MQDIYSFYDDYCRNIHYGKGNWDYDDEASDYLDLVNDLWESIKPEEWEDQTE